KMIRAVVGFCQSLTNAPITTTVPAFESLITGVLQTSLATISILRALIAQPITGYASQKKQLKEALVVMMATMMKAVYAYAVAVGNNVLAGQMKTSRSKLRKMNYEQFVMFV